MTLDLSTLNKLSDLAKSAVLAEHSSVESIRKSGSSRNGKRLPKPIRYAKPSMKEVVSPGAGGGLWTGSQPEDQILLNQPLRHTKAAKRLAAKGGTLNLAEWPDEKLALWLKTIGRRNARLLEMTRRQNIAEHFDREKVIEAIDEIIAEDPIVGNSLAELADRFNSRRS